MLNVNIPHLEVIQQFYPHLLILSTLWATYSYVIFRGGFVSDDLMGIDQYDGTLQYPVELPDGSVEKDKDGKVVKKTKICYGTLSKWVRYHLCGGHFPSRHLYKKPDGSNGDPIPSGKVASHHHAMSVIFASIALILLYQFLIGITTPKVALLTCLLFAVHPTCIQAIAWPSAIGYILSLICITATLNISQWVYYQPDLAHILIGLAGIAFFQVWGIYAQAIPIATWLILLVLGQWEMALVSLFFSGATASVNLREYVVYRKSEFKKQNMEKSTKLSIRKPVIALKTLAYYLYLSVFPNRLGLYHQWGFHYDKKMELWDWRALVGVAFIAISAFAFPQAPIEVKVGIIWFLSFLLLFLNWITAQQWVTERYLYIPIVGLCLIASLFLQHLMPLYYIIFGLLMCRTLCHLPTYDNELRFYLSNTWNFPKSEVAFGNLGVTFASAGLSGAASDMWTISGSLNPDYDVPYYNLFSKLKSQGLLLIQQGVYEQGVQTLAQSIPIMEKVLTCKTLHFPEMWRKEKEDLEKLIQNPQYMLVEEMHRLTNLKNALNLELKNCTNKKRISELLPSVHDNENQINNLSSFLKSRGIIIEYNPEKALLSRLTQRR